MQYLLTQEEYNKLQTEAARWRELNVGKEDFDQRLLKFKQACLLAVLDEVRNSHFRAPETIIESVKRRIGPMTI